MSQHSYSNYGKLTERTDLTMPLKQANHLIKKDRIYTYGKNCNMLIDIGSGRGNDIGHWTKNDIKKVIGIEPSDKSIKQSIIFCKKRSELDKQQTKITFIRGVGNKLWKNGDAGLSEQDSSTLKYFFGKLKVSADLIFLFWTIHYMMDTEQDFSTLCQNIKNHSKKGARLIILCMDGQLVDQKLKETTGSYSAYINDEPYFTITSKYDHTKSFEQLEKFGTHISVEIKGVYGLGNNIQENLVDINFLINELKKYGFILEERKKFTDFTNIQEVVSMGEFEKNVAGLYTSLVFISNDVSNDVQ